MTRVITTIGLVAALAMPMTVSAQSQRRSADRGPENEPRGPGPVPVPRYPYAGEWDGTVAMEGANAQTRIAMKFTVSDGSRQSYAGETTMPGRAAMPHLNISAAPLTTAGEKTSGSVARRSPGTPETGSGPSAPAAPERDILASGDRALLLYHAPTKSMALCDEGHRCIGLATLTWDETGSDGTKYAYTANLVAADTIKGTVTVTKGSSSQTGTFTLTRRK